MIDNEREKPVKKTQNRKDWTENGIKLEPIKHIENITSVNWHIWERCNYKCKFCFATFSQVNWRLPKEQALMIPILLANSGVKKLNFVGGEPLLCPYIDALLSVSKEAGLVTSIVTNATRLTRKFLEDNACNIDWIGISIDSQDENTEKCLGRGTGNHVKMVVSRAKMVKEFGIKLKVNTVVTSLNFNEDMSSLITELGPDRWKVFQMLPINGENQSIGMDLTVDKSQFMEFVSRHKHLNPVAEDNDSMTGSYLMLDPLGRFFQNWNQRYVRSKPILDVGVSRAIEQVGWSNNKFIERGGDYSW